ncbi:MAG: hypothetical protein HOQ02_02255 [Lysobacter sp.]|nr:hypothetical protein [Lysobacter sp.]
MATSHPPCPRTLAAGALACMLSLGLPLATPARSAPSAASIERCIARDGGSVYTDKPCALFGAQAAPLSGELMSRLANDRHVMKLQGDADGPMPVALDGVAPSASAAPGRRSAAAGCARSPQQLADDMRGSLALGDVNRLAESYHWVGMSHREGEHVLDRLARLLGREAIDSRYYAAQIASLSDGGMPDAGDSRGGDGGILQVMLAGRGAPSVLDFDVHRYAGCYFVSFPRGVSTIA